MMAHRILIVDDDPSWQELLSESIQEAGLGPHRLQVASSRAEAEALLDRQHFHLAFVDLRLREEARELEGKQIVRKIVAQDEGTTVVIVTGHADVETALTALKEWKVLDFVLKDAWDPEKVIQIARIKKSCRHCERMVQEPAPSRPIPGSMAGPRSRNF